MGSSRRSRALAALVLLALVAMPGALSAQRRPGPLVLSGRLVRARGDDTLVIGGARVVAHRVGALRQGPIDSMRTDAGGGFRFVVAAPESGAVYVVSTLHQGIGYFSDPIVPGTSRSAALTLVVFDTSSTGPPLEVASRNVVVTRERGGQERRVLDIYQVTNSGTTTRVGEGGRGAPFTFRLPDGVTDPQSGASDIPASAIRFEGGRALVMAPFPPGDKQVVISYTLPAGQGTLEVPVDHATGEVDLMLEDSTAQASAPLHATDPVAVEGHTFRRYAASDMRAGSSFRVSFASGRERSRRTTLLAVVLAGVLLAVGAAFLLTRRGATVRPPSGSVPPRALAEETQDRLVAQIAALDDRFSGRERSTPPEAWAAYQSRRAELVAALERRLAQG